MKNTLKFIALALIVSVAACKKVSNTPETEKTNVISDLKTEDLVNARTVNGKAMADYIEFPTDPEMSKMNKGLYLYMEGLKEVFQQRPQMLQMILNKAKSTNKNTVVVTNYLSHFGLCKSVFNSKLTVLCPEKPVGTDHASSVALELMNYNGNSQYQPLMMLYNNCPGVLEPLTLTEGFRMALGTDVEESNNNGNGNTTGKGKLIPCWQIKKNGDVQLELISQQEASNSNIPVFIFTPGYVKNGIAPSQPTDDYQYVDVNDGDGGVFIINGGCANAGNLGGSGSSGNSGGNSTSGGGSGNTGSSPASGQLFLDGVNLAYHYEAAGASELRLSYRVNDDVTSGTVQKLKLLDVPSNYIDCICYKSVGTPLMNIGTTPNQNYVFLLYEHDWYASEKTFNYTSFGNTSLNLKFDATLQGEVYMFKYFTISSHYPNPNTNINFPYGINYASVTRY